MNKNIGKQPTQNDNFNVNEGREIGAEVSITHKTIVIEGEPIVTGGLKRRNKKGETQGEPKPTVTGGLKRPKGALSPLAQAVNAYLETKDMVSMGQTELEANLPALAQAIINADVKKGEDTETRDNLMSELLALVSNAEKEADKMTDANTLVEQIKASEAISVEDIASFITGLGRDVKVKMLDEVLEAHGKKLAGKKADKIQAVAELFGTDINDEANKFIKQDQVGKQDPNTEKKDDVDSVELNTMEKAIQEQNAITDDIIDEGRTIIKYDEQNNGISEEDIIPTEKEGESKENKEGKVERNIEKVEEISFEEMEEKADKSTLKYFELENYEDVDTKTFPPVTVPGKMLAGFFKKVKNEENKIVDSDIAVRKVRIRPADELVVVYYTDDTFKADRIGNTFARSVFQTIIKNINAYGTDVERKEVLRYINALETEGEKPVQVRVLQGAGDINNIVLRNVIDGKVVEVPMSEYNRKEHGKYFNVQRKKGYADGTPRYSNTFLSTVTWHHPGNLKVENLGKKGNLLTFQPDSALAKMLQPETTTVVQEVVQADRVDGVDKRTVNKKVTENVRILPELCVIKLGFKVKTEEKIQKAIINRIKETGQLPIIDTDENGNSIQTTVEIAGASVSHQRNGSAIFVDSKKLPTTELLRRCGVDPVAFNNNAADMVKRIFLNLSSGVDQKFDELVKDCVLKVSPDNVCGMNTLRVQFVHKETGVVIFTVSLASEVLADVSEKIKYRGFDVSKKSMKGAITEVPESVRKAFGQLRNAGDGAGIVSSRVAYFNHSNGLLVGQELSFQNRMYISGENTATGEKFSLPANKGAFMVEDEIANLFNADVVLFADCVKAKGVFTYGNETIDVKKLTATKEFTFDNARLESYIVGSIKEEETLGFLASQVAQHLVRTKECAEKLNFAGVLAIAKQIENDNFEAIHCDERGNGEYDLADLDGADYVDPTKVAILAVREHMEASNDAYISKSLVKRAFDLSEKLYKKSRIAMEYAKNRYMFYDWKAAAKALKAGSIYNNAIVVYTKNEKAIESIKSVSPNAINEDGYVDFTIIEEDTVFVATKKGVLLGRCASARYPFSHIAEAYLTEAVYNEEYVNSTLVLGGKVRNVYAGCIIYCSKSVALEQQSGADQDGDTAVLFALFLLLETVEKMNETPILDIWFDGQAFKKGAVAKVKVNWNTGSIIVGEEAGPKVIEFRFATQTIRLVDGQISKEDMAKFTKVGKQEELVAAAFKAVTRSTVAMVNELGKYANAIMTLMDLRTILTNKKEIVLLDDIVLGLLLCVRWEVDKIKHGGSFTKHPAIAKVIAATDYISFGEDKNGNYISLNQNKDDEAKKVIFAENIVEAKEIVLNILENNPYTFLVEHYTFKETKKGFNAAYIQKPKWLAAQKDEFGKEIDSLFAYQTKHAMAAVASMGKKLVANESVGEIRNLLLDGIPYNQDKMNACIQAVTVPYNEVMDFQKSNREKREALVAEIVSEMEKREPKTNWEKMKEAKLLDRAKHVAVLADVLQALKEEKEVLRAYNGVFKERVFKSLPFSKEMIALAFYQVCVTSGKRYKTKSEVVNGQLIIDSNWNNTRLPWTFFASELISILGMDEEARKELVLDGEFERAEAGFQLLAEEDEELPTVEELENAVLVRAPFNIVEKGKKVEKDCLLICEKYEEGDKFEYDPIAYVKVNSLTKVVFPYAKNKVGVLTEQIGVTIVPANINDNGTVVVTLTK